MLKKDLRARNIISFRLTDKDYDDMIDMLQWNFREGRIKKNTPSAQMIKFINAFRDYRDENPDKFPKHSVELPPLVSKEIDQED